MANPARRYEETDPAARATDPVNPVPPLATDPATDSRYRAANDPRVDNSTVVQSRSAGNGVLIAALVIVLAVIAYFIFAPGTPETTVPADQPATTGETTAPDATAPAAPADGTTTAPADTTTAPAPDATAPAPAPDATAPAAPADGATTAPEATAPADSAPAGTAPAEPAPAQ